MVNTPTFSALIVAAGSGSRHGGPLPKQYQLLDEHTVLHHTVLAILALKEVSELCVVIAPDDVDLYQKVASGISDPRLGPPALGGNTRSQSVANGLNTLSGTHVLIHDAARPAVPLSALERLIETLATQRAAFLALPVTDAIWSVESDVARKPVARETLWRAQTPQAFRLNDIKTAHQNQTTPADDDVAMARNAGIDVTAVLGSEQNIKITHQGDIERVKRLMRQNMDIRTGIGYDVHALGQGDHVILNGIKIPHTSAMIGHSDADVAMHAITDALFGALAEGDIGQWFPPSDIQWKGAASDIFLRKAVERCAARNFTISNIDCTIICEMPKIGPHAQSMRENLAKITGVDIDRICVKATTSERLGFTGRGEGIAAQAIATLVSK